MFSTWDMYPILYGTIILLIVRYLLRPRKYDLRDIPAVGSSSFFVSYYYAFKNQSDARKMVQQGYEKCRASAFRIPLLLRWEVVIAGPKLVEEFWKYGDDELSLKDAFLDELQTLHTMGADVHHNDYHVEILRSRLTRNLSTLLPDIKDEICAAFNEIISPSNDWTAVVALPTLMQIICRTSNRIFVGLPTCRDKDYCELNIQYTVDVMRSASILRLLPDILRPLAKHLVADLPSRLAQAIKHLEPVIQEQYRLLEQYGDNWHEKPNDMLMWLMEEAIGKERTMESIVARILVVNIAAIHTTSMAFTEVLFRLASHPEYLATIRAEVEAVVKSDGWTKLALQKMRKLDSFFRECQRYQGIGAASRRLARKDIQFSDGTRIPRGTYVSISSMTIHRDSEYYDDPDTFNPWRFSGLQEDEMLKHQMVSTSNKYLTFGHGRHTCPGRFFAANELKCMMAHLVLNYDVKMEQEGVMPEPAIFEFAIVPNPKAKVLFRKRREF